MKESKLDKIHQVKQTHQQMNGYSFLKLPAGHLKIVVAGTHLGLFGNSLFK